MSLKILFVGFVALFSGTVSSVPKGDCLNYEAASHAICWTWQSGPRVGEESRLVLRFSDIQGQPVDPLGPIEVVLWMPGMNHGSAPTQVQQVARQDGGVEIGTFLVSNMFFVMGGHWEIKIVVSPSNAPVWTGKIDLRLNGHGGHHRH